MPRPTSYIFLHTITLALTLFLSSCKPSASSATIFPDLPPMTRLQSGISFCEIGLTRAGIPMKLWLYLPNSPPTEKLPCILIAPAGTPLFHGVGLATEDRAEHLPYALKGFAVLAYEIDGDLGKDPTNSEAATAIKAFRSANAGIANAQTAIDYAAEKIPQIDLNRIYAVGHSSAATLALQVAQNEPRIAACVAYAPAVDLPNRLIKAGPLLERLQPGSMAFLENISPDRNVDKLTCPTFLFTARDDTNVTSPSIIAFADLLKKTNPNVKLITVSSGGHYESMINQGIPAAIPWLQQLPPHPQ